MIMKVKFCVDSKNNVGIFNVDIKPGENHLVFEETTSQAHYHLSFLNDGGTLYTRIINPERASKGEPAKTRQKSQANDVYNVGGATVMVLTISSGDTGEKSATVPPPVQATEVIQQPVTQIAGPVNEDTFKRKLNTQTDLSKLPDTKKLKINYDYVYTTTEDRYELNTSKKQEVASQTVPKQSKKPADSERMYSVEIKNRTREQLFISDPRDRRFFIQGSKFALRNKVGAAFVVLALLTIVCYSVVFKYELDKLNFRKDLQAQEVIMEGASTQLISKLSQVNNAVDTLSLGIMAVQGTSDTGVELKKFDPAFARNHFIANVSIYRLDAPDQKPLQEKPKSKAINKSTHKGLMVAMRPAKKPKVALPEKKNIAPLGPYDVVLLSGETLRLVYQHTKHDVIRKHSGSVRELLQAHQKIWSDRITQGRMLASAQNDPLNLPNLREHFYTVTKMINENGKKLFMSYDVDLSFLTETLPHSNQFRVGLLNSSGQVVGPDGFRFDPAALVYLDGMVENEYRSAEIAGQKRMVAFKKVSSGLHIYSDFKISEGNLVMSTMMNVMIFSGVVLALMSWMGAWFAKSLTNGLTQLTLSLENVAAGNYYTLPQVNSDDEIGVLSDYISHLSTTLETRDEEITRVTNTAPTDPLTGLRSHKYFKEKIEEQMNQYIQDKKPFSVLVMDIDNFKDFNTQFGHLQGDEVLKELADLLSQIAREKDVVVRYGGEEFGLLLPETDTLKATQLVDKLMAKIRGHKVNNLTGGSKLSCTCSMGIVTYTAQKQQTMQHLLKSAEDNLRMAKKSGKNRAWTGEL